MLLLQLKMLTLLLLLPQLMTLMVPQQKNLMPLQLMIPMVPLQKNPTVLQLMNPMVPQLKNPTLLRLQQKNLIVPQLILHTALQQKSPTALQLMNHMLPQLILPMVPLLKNHTQHQLIPLTVLQFTFQKVIFLPQLITAVLLKRPTKPTSQLPVILVQLSQLMTLQLITIAVPLGIFTTIKCRIFILKLRHNAFCKSYRALLSAILLD